jgi:outer membrane protein OmpA-like peptidoglycan-associated protein
MRKMVGVLLVGLWLAPVFAVAAEGDGGNANYEGISEIQQDLLSIRAEIDDFKVVISDLIGEIRARRAELAALNNDIALAQANLARVNGELAAARSGAERPLGVPVAGVSETFVISDAEVAEWSLRDSQVVGSGQGSTAAVAAVSADEVFVLNETDFAVAAATGSVVKKADYGSVLETVYFGPDSVALPECVIPSIESIAETLIENPNLFITIRGYSAPAGTEAGQLEVSKGRAFNCAEYLLSKFNIPSEQVKIEWVGAKLRPKTASDNKTSLRVVEFILGEDYV